MAELVKAFGTSHSPALNSTVEDYHLHAEIDRGVSHWKRQLLDKAGNPATYEEILDQADPNIAGQISAERIGERVDQCQTHIARLKADINDADLDALIIIGDDQHEQYFDDNMPAIMIYRGDSICNNVLKVAEDSPAWWQRARSQYHEESEARDYPVAADLGLHLIEALMDRDFDVSQSSELRFERGESHSFGFFHRKLMDSGRETPIVPVALNTYYPPNQPRPKRCYALGQAIREAVAAWDNDARVGILASGGLSHFTVDEELDTGLLAACRDKDEKALTSIPPKLLNSGNSEIRNWITTAGAAEHLDVAWTEYVPCYRSPAGTGCGMAFASWG